MSFNFESIMYSLKFKKTINNPKNALQAPLQFVRGILVTRNIASMDIQYKVGGKYPLSPFNPHQTTCSLSAPPLSAACQVQEGRQGSVRKNVGRNLPFIKHRITRIHTD